MKVDPELLTACRKGDRKAQHQLYKECYSPLMQVCVRYHNQQDEAVEVLNQGFLKVLTHLDRYRSEVPFKAWIKRIMINTIIDNFRRSKKHRESHQYQDMTQLETEDLLIDYNEADQELDAADIRAMINKLPPISQKVFNLYIVDGYNHKEIAEMLNISPATSRWHVSSSRKTIQKMIGNMLTTIKSVML